MQLVKRLMRDDAGFVVSMELVLIATILVIGMITGLTAVRDAATSEMSDVAGALQDVNQSYQYHGILGHSAAVAGSDFIDQTDYCDSPGAAANTIDNCIVISSGTLIDEGEALPAPPGA